MMADEVDFDWDTGNVGHLKAHRVTPREFEEVILNDRLDLEYRAADGEPRYKPIGAAMKGRILIAVWTQRAGKIRAITAYPAGINYRRLWTERRA